MGIRSGYFKAPSNHATIIPPTKPTSAKITNSRFCGRALRSSIPRSTDSTGASTSSSEIRSVCPTISTLTRGAAGALGIEGEHKKSESSPRQMGTALHGPVAALVFAGNEPGKSSKLVNCDFRASKETCGMRANRPKTNYGSIHPRDKCRNCNDNGSVGESWLNRLRLKVRFFWSQRRVATVDGASRTNENRRSPEEAAASLSLRLQKAHVMN